MREIHCTTPGCAWHGALTVERMTLDNMNRPVCGACQKLAEHIQVGPEQTLPTEPPPPPPEDDPAEEESDPDAESSE